MQITLQYKSFHLVLLICILMFFIGCNVKICSAETQICGGVNYTKGSKYESNLNDVLDHLVNNINSSSNGFNTSVSGQTPDKAYALLQCRGDATPEQCYNCSQKAKTDLRRDCGNAMGGRSTGWYEKCFMRYENYSFFGVPDLKTSISHSTAYAPDPAVFSAAVKGLFENLTNEAYGSANRYSSGTTEVSSFNFIYGLVQCWRDLTSIDDCRKCLKTVIRELLAETTDGTRVVGVCSAGSCIAHYETDPFFNPSPPPPPTSGKSSNKLVIILGILGGLLVMFLLCIFTIRRKLTSALFGKSLVLGKENRGMEVGLPISQDEQIIFTLEILRAATRNFHEDNKLGEGGFGPVYKGTMPDGKQIAVKKLSLQSQQGKKEFLNEVKLVAKIQHRNLVNLLGCCAEGSERLLVYEFLSNKSLDQILFNSERGKKLDWKKRLNIIRGVARGLLYLHEDSQLRIIHRDIKTSNILLDEKMEPKISDFGLARLFPRDETHVNTRIAGTLGYMAPEYAMGGQLSAKADIYSFGVVLLEIVCGRKNTDINFLPEFQSLLELVWTFYTRGNIVEMIDKEIIESCPREYVSSCIRVGLLCTQADASLRPPMSTVYTMLSNPSLTILPDPTKPPFLSVTQKDIPPEKDKHVDHFPTFSTSSGTTNSATMSSSSDSSATPLLNPSINDASVTDMEAR